MIDKKAIKALEDQMQKANAAIQDALANVPEEHRSFFDPYINAVNNKENIDINAFMQKLKQYASRCNSN